MSSDELLTIVLLLTLGIGATWLLITAVDRWASWRRRQEARPRRPGAVAAPPPGRPQPVPTRPAPAQPEPPRPRVVLDPPQRVHLDRALVRPQPTNGLVIRRGPPLVVPAHTDPLWKEKGWRCNGAGYEGFFRAAGRAWQGLIQEPYPGRYQAFIWRPPLVQIERNTPHRACFQNGRSDGRYQVHYSTTPNNLDHAIGTIEEVLADAFGVGPRR